MTFDKAVQTLMAFLAIKNDVPRRADVILVLGSSSCAPPRKAAALWHGFRERGQNGPPIAFISVGGIWGNERADNSEVGKYDKILSECGVPPQKVFSEPLARSIHDEVWQAIPFLQRHGVNPRNVILVSEPLYQRRAWMTFSNKWEDIVFYNVPAEEYVAVEPRRILQELDRLRKYGEKGDCEVQGFPWSVVKAWDVLTASFVPT